MIKYLRLCLVCTCIMLSSCGGQASTAKSASDASNNQFFYVVIFDGYFPIPMRYKLGPISNLGQRIRFTSSPLHPEISLNEVLNENQLAGGISISEIEDCTFCDNHDEALYYLGNYQRFELDDSVVVLKSMNKDETKAVFFDDEMFIYVTDEDPRLYDDIVKRIKNADGQQVQEKLVQTYQKEE